MPNFSIKETQWDNAYIETMWAIEIFLERDTPREWAREIFSERGTSRECVRLRCHGRSGAILILYLTTKRSTTIIVVLIPMIESNAWRIIIFVSTNQILWNALATFVAHCTPVKLCLLTTRPMCTLTTTGVGGSALTAAHLLVEMTKSTSAVSVVDRF